MSKAKVVNFKLIEPAHEDGKPTEPYRILQQVRDKYHANLDGAHIALAWRTNWKANTDG